MNLLGTVMGWLFLIACGGAFVWLAWAVATDRYAGHRRRVGLSALCALWFVTAGVLVLRFVLGLGPTTHMTDAFPWGVWIGAIQSGVALSGGGFVMAATVHVFHIRRFEPILRPAVLTAFLGYNFVALSLLIEVGRPYRMWHPIAMWQHHSIMFEVAWCVTLYMTVLALEFSPVLFDHFDWPAGHRLFEIVAIPLVVAGVLLSTLHQSSLGSMFLLVPEKIYPLWYTPLLPIFFLLSSVMVGLCVIVVEFFYASKIFGQTEELKLLPALARTASWVLFLYWGLKIADLSFRGAWSYAAPTTLQGVSFWIEILLGGALPLLLLNRDAVHRSPVRLMLSAVLVIAGVILNRLNTSWIGMLSYTGPVYTPSWMEFAVTFSLATGVATLFGLASKYLPVFSATPSLFVPEAKS